MEYSEYKENFLLALDEREVLEKLERIIVKSLEGSSQEEVKRLKEELVEYKEKVGSITSENNKLNQMVQKLLGDIQGQQKDFQKKSVVWKEVQQIYSPMYSTYQIYQQISQSARNALKGIFKDEEPAAWIAAGSQPENISSLWEFTKMQIMKRRYEDVKYLSDLIYYFIDLYNKTKNEPIYKMQKVSPGDVFDVEEHIRTSSSKAAGKISKVILFGYLNVKTNLVIKNSVVEV